MKISEAMWFGMAALLLGLIGYGMYLDGRALREYPYECEMDAGEGYIVLSHGVGEATSTNKSTPAKFVHKFPCYTSVK